MMSNRELAAKAEELGSELGIEVSTEGLNKAKLTALVEELESKAGGDSGQAKTRMMRNLDAIGDAVDRIHESARSAADAVEQAGAPEKPDLLRSPEGPVDGANATQGGPPPKAVGFRAKHPLTVGANKSVMCRRGRLNAGDEVKESDFDAKTLQHLISIDCVIDRRS